MKIHMTKTETLEALMFSGETAHFYTEITVEAIEEERMRITARQEYMQRNHEVPDQETTGAFLTRLNYSLPIGLIKQAG